MPFITEFPCNPLPNKKLLPFRRGYNGTKYAVVCNWSTAELICPFPAALINLVHAVFLRSHHIEMRGKNLTPLQFIACKHRFVGSQNRGQTMLGSEEYERQSYNLSLLHLLANLKCCMLSGEQSLFAISVRLHKTVLVGLLQIVHKE